MLSVLVVIRLLTPPGYMPSWSIERFAIVPCDYSRSRAVANDEPTAHHDHGKNDSGRDGDDKAPQPCPYAAVSSQSFVNAPAALIPAGAPAMPVLDVPVLRPIERYDRTERPHSRAPPPGLS